ncbi:MAG: TolC family protein [Prevotellaceae bacterium]|jgi:outer membrane protein TolC|nr:TolC family protein [Prevotellaceae bacterium]
MKNKIFVFLFFIPTLILSQEKYTLKQCIELGLEQNYAIKIVKNSQQISDNNASIGNAGFLPTVDLSAGYSGTLNNTEQFPFSGDKISNNNIHNYGFNAGIDVNWTVFNGFSVLTNYHKLKELQQIGELNTRVSVENFISNFSSEYYNYIRQSIREKSLRFAIELSKERYRIAKTRYEIGNLSLLEVQQAEVYLNADKSNLMKQHETLNSIRYTLKELLAIKDIELPIEFADTIINYDIFLYKEELWQKTLENNVFLHIAKKENEISRLDLKNIQSRNYPYLRFNAGYGYSQNRYETGTYQRQDNLGLNYGLTLGFNIFDGMNRKRQQQNAKIEMQNNELNYKQLELSLYSDISNAWMAFQNNMKLVDLERGNLQTAKNYYEIAMERYLLGELSGFELREAQTNLLNAEERLVQAEFDTKLCEITLMQISGQLLKYLE